MKSGIKRLAKKKQAASDLYLCEKPANYDINVSGVKDDDGNLKIGISDSSNGDYSSLHFVLNKSDLSQLIKFLTDHRNNL